MKIVKQIEKTANNKIFHPFLLSVYPILGLYALNVAEGKLSEIYRPILVSMLLTLLLLFLVKMILKNWLKSALIVSLTQLVFFSYGHIYNYLKAISIGDFVIGRHRFLLPAAIGLFIFGVIWILRRSQNATNINKMMNLVMTSIMIFPIYQIGSFWIGDPNSRLNHPLESDIQTGNFMSLLDYQPDVYFIILDEYTRSDTLKTLYDYDNEPFLSELREMGFFVAECSQSNYSHTKPTLASSLNMDLMQNLWQGSFNTYDFNFLIWNSKFRRLVESQGYLFVALESGAYWSEITTADIYFSETGSSSSAIEKMGNFGRLSDFEGLLLDTTILSALNDYQFLLLTLEINLSDDSRMNRRRIVLYELDTLNNLPGVINQKFVFAHIISPHLPFVFGPNGEFADEIYKTNPNSETYQEGYTNQVTYLNSRLPKILDNIILNSEHPPIIIVIGDHGPSRTNQIFRSTILTAVYLPEDGNQYFYDDITPINIFRIISKYYFGLDLGMVQDIHYNVPYETAETKILPKVYTPIIDPNEDCNNKND